MVEEFLEFIYLKKISIQKPYQNYKKNTIFASC